VEPAQPIGDAPADIPPPRSRLHRVYTRVHWTDGTRSEHRTLTYNWTTDRVLVWVPARRDGVDRRNIHMVWVPAGQVRRNTDPPQLGETVPAPHAGPTAVVVWGSRRRPRVTLVLCMGMSREWQASRRGVPWLRDHATTRPATRRSDAAARRHHKHHAPRSPVLPGAESGARVPGHFDAYGAPAGSEPRSNHGQTIKRPVTLSE
jgi:hypothetical protein